jgi:DNA mismatch repair protein MutL
MVHFEDISGNLRVHGFLSRPDLTRGNRTMQFYFVNGRIIRNRLLSHAVHQAYHSLIPRDKYPLLALFLEIPPELVDVNVHPTKAEIRFRNERDVHRLVQASIRTALGGQSNSFRDRVESVYRTIFPGSQGESEAIADGQQEKSREQLEWFFKEAPTSLFEDQPEQNIVTSGGLYWQLHESFILIQIRGGMVIVDQHAAHERILFDAAKKSLEEIEHVIQPLLFPATLELTPEEYERFDEIQDLLPSIGFDVEPFGPRSIIVRGIPAGVRNWNDGQLLQSILSDEGGDMDALLKSFACHAAVRAGTSLTAEEMESLTDQLFATEFPFTCPHGRPTMLRLGTAELERRFQRTAKSEK